MERSRTGGRELVVDEIRDPNSVQTEKVFGRSMSAPRERRLMAREESSGSTEGSVRSMR